MNIIIGTTRPFHLFHLARELNNLNNNVTIFSYMPDFLIRSYDSGDAKHVSLFWFHPVLVFMALQKKWRSAQDYATNKLMSIIDKDISKKISRCDVYIGLSGMAVSSIKQAKKIGALTVCDRGSSHVLVQDQILKNELNSKQLYVDYINRELEGYEQADIIAVPSIFSKNSFEASNVPGNKIFVNNYGVDLSRFQKRKPTKRGPIIKMLYVGNWSYQKGCDLFEKVLHDDEFVELTHIGTRGDIPFPKSSRFQTLGPVANSQLPEHYKAADVFVFPSRQDGFGMVLLEALASGLPVIASTNCGALDAKRAISQSSELINIIPEISASALNEALIKFNEQQLSNIIEKKNEFNRNEFSWSAYGKRYNDFLINQVKN